MTSNRRPRNFDIKDIEAEHTLLNNAAGIVGRPFGHGKFLHSSLEIRASNGIFLHVKEKCRWMLDSFYEIGAKSALTCVRHMEQSIQNDYPNFRYQLAASAGQ